jgi:hypothetical protein
VIANTARIHARQIRWLDTTNDAALDELRVLNGYDIDLAADTNRVTNRLRDALVAVSPALERALGHRLHQSGPRHLLAKWSTPTALRATTQTRVTKLLVASMPRAGPAIVAEVYKALDSQTIVLLPNASLVKSFPNSQQSLNGSTSAANNSPNTMFLAAFASLRSPDSKEFYDRKRASGKRHNAAVICLARRRCDVILAMLRTGQHYQQGNSTQDQETQKAA